jgi:hypothetical protein
VRHPNHRLVKIHRTYTVFEVAHLFGVHRNTVREWIRRGLPTCDQHRRTLIVGRALAEYLKKRREQRRTRCGADEMYCMRCRQARRPVENAANYVPRTSMLGTLVGACPACAAVMHRTVNLAKFADSGSKLVVTPPIAQRDIGDTCVPFVNSDFE